MYTGDTLASGTGPQWHNSGPLTVETQAGVRYLYTVSSTEPAIGYYNQQNSYLPWADHLGTNIVNMRFTCDNTRILLPRMPMGTPKPLLQNRNALQNEKAQCVFMLGYTFFLFPTRRTPV